MHGFGGIDIQKNYSLLNEISLRAFLDTIKDEGYDKSVAIVLINVSSDELKQPAVQSRLSYIAERTLYTEGYNATIFIVSPQCVIPYEMEQLVTLIPTDKPTQKEIEAFLQDYARELEFTIAEADIGELALQLKGLSLFLIKRILDTAYVDGGVISKEDTKLILLEKKQAIKRSGLLEFVASATQLDGVGGLGRLKSWLKHKGQIIANLDAALKAGVSTPKGILIVGYPGCGKSLVAKNTAAQFKLPLLRLDVGRILGKYVGESEQRMRQALELAEAVSPCVLWVDEVEKAFGGASGSEHEVTSRLIGNFLTWMQEKESTVFVVATANDLERLPTEFLRKGRFDEVFSVDLPNDQERYQIIKIHLQQRGQYNHTLDLTPVVAQTKDFSGADIEAGINIATERIFLKNIKSKKSESLCDTVAQEELLSAMVQITPLSSALKKKFEALKEKLREYNVTAASDTK
jgi:SpoVK/Ycf46/Vps4 family AAA+-type ATPase